MQMQVRSRPSLRENTNLTHLIRTPMPSVDRTRKCAHSDLAADRRLTQPRDPLRRSRDTNVSDTPIMAERGGHGRDGPVIPRESTAATAGGGGGGGSRTGGGGGLESVGQ